MSLDNTTVFEWRAASGSNANGGGFADLDPGVSVDYSQQNSPQLAITDGATSGVGVTTLTSATGGFTAAMLGNVACIVSGTNATAGLYQITGYTDTNTVTLDRAPDDGVGGVSGATCNVGGARAVFTDAVIDQAVAGHWVKNDGAMTLTEDINIATSATPTGAIFISGYDTTRGDDPDGTTRPLLACGAYYIKTANYWRVDGLRVTGTSLYLLQIGYANVVERVKVDNSSTSINRYALYCGAGMAMLRDCDVSCINGYGAYFGSGTYAVGLNMHGCVIGYKANAASVALSLIWDCSNVGCLLSNSQNCAVMNCTIDSCVTGISATGNAYLILNNSISNNSTLGIDLPVGTANCLIDYNNYYGNTADVSGVSKGDHATALDPQYTDRVNGDFSRTGTNLNETGFGVAGGEPDQGAWFAAASGGGGGTTVIVVEDE